MSDINGLIAGIDYDPDEDVIDASPSTDAGATQPADAGTQRPARGRSKAPHPSMGPKGSPVDGASLPGAKKYKIIKDLGPLPTPNFKFEKPAKLNNDRVPVRRAMPKPARGVRPEEIDPPIHAAPSPDDAAGSDPGEPTEAQDASAVEAGPAPPAIDPEAAWKLIREVYKDKPVEFALDIIGVTPDEWQASAMDYTGKGGRLLSVVAGHGVGKSAFCAWLVLWHMTVYFPQKTVLTAPTQGQLFDALFSEVKFWLRRMPAEIRDLFDAQSERIVYRAEPEASFVSARTSSKERPEALAGIHCEEGSVLLIADEASAIAEEVYEAATGSMSGRTAHTVLISNGTRVSGLFYNTHHNLAIKAEDTAEEAIGKWKTMQVSCIGNKRADTAFVKQIVETYGIDSNQYRVRVLGLFSTREDDVLIAAELVDAAVSRDMELDPQAPLVYGVDVARFGDDKTVLCKRRGNVVIEIKWWSKEDTMQTVGRVMVEAKLDSPDEICVDSIGLGAGVADRLRQLGFNVRDVNVSEAAAMNPMCNRLRDDLWLQVKDWFNTRACKIPDSDRLKQDLKAPTYGFAMNGKIVVEPKAMMKKRRLPSPDFADALCLTFASDAAMVGGRAFQWVPGKPLRRNLAGVV